MYTAGYIKYPLNFLKPAGTSRGVLNEKASWFFRINDTANPQILGIGECSLIPGLSIDKLDNFEDSLIQALIKIQIGELDSLHFPDHPSIQFGIETAIQDFKTGGKRILFPTDFSSGKSGIPINGLIWMGDKKSMVGQVKAKIEQGFRILKLKIGAIHFEDELNILKSIRTEFKEKELEIRLDANGAWKSKEAIAKLNRISEYNIHSLEQPIAAGNPEDMAMVCSDSPIAIALDEELIGLKGIEKKHHLLRVIKPAYIILKPSLLGGFRESEEWIEIAKKQDIGWWITSALESNIGLNAIAQWTASLETNMPQGLGTGSLYSNNIPSPLSVVGDNLYHLPEQEWDLSNLKF